VAKAMGQALDDAVAQVAEAVRVRVQDQRTMLIPPKPTA
jgi:hypothetical protein